MKPQTDDEVLAALDELCAVLRDGELLEQAIARAELLYERRREGVGYSELVTDEERPLLVEIISRRLEQLSVAGSRFRRAEAAALHAEGMTMDQIAKAFGVTRQRVSAILREERTRGQAG